MKIIVYLLTSLSTLAPKNAFTYFFIVSYNFWIRQSSIFTEYKFLATYSKFVYDVSYNFWIRQSSIFTEYKFLATYSKFVYDDYT